MCSHLLLTGLELANTLCIWQYGPTELRLRLCRVQNLRGLKHLKLYGLQQWRMCVFHGHLCHGVIVICTLSDKPIPNLKLRDLTTPRLTVKFLMHFAEVSKNHYCSQFCVQYCVCVLACIDQRVSEVINKLGPPLLEFGSLALPVINFLQSPSKLTNLMLKKEKQRELEY